MNEPALTDRPAAAADPSLSLSAASAPQACDECVGTGGWFRYDPAQEPAGLLYLSCLGCRGSGRTAGARG